MTRTPTLLLILSPAWRGIEDTSLGDGRLRLIRHGRDAYDPAEIDYVLSFRPPPGLLAKLTGLKAVFSMGAGIDGFLAGGDYPAHLPLVRFSDDSLSAEMAQYLLLYALAHHRGLRLLEARQAAHDWQEAMLPRRTEDTRIGFLGLGAIGSYAADLFIRLGFPVSGWSRGVKSIPGIKSFAGPDALPAFFAQSDIAICLLALTPETKGILNARAFAAMPKGALVINAARGAHLVSEDLLAALDSGHLSGAVLDVFEPEPLPKDSPLWSHPKITVTPHIAAFSQGDVVARHVLAGIAAFERGEMPDNIVDIARGY